MKIIGHIRTDYKSKFGIPKQSGLIKESYGRIVFEPEFKNPEILKGLELFSHIWIIWKFSENEDRGWQPTVRPPILGGNKKMGVFATRSPFRPNPVGLSAVKIVEILCDTPEGPVIIVESPDLMDNTPIYDIKPYIPFSDRLEDAVVGFSNPSNKEPLEVIITDEQKNIIDDGKWDALKSILSMDPRPAYHNDPFKIYKFEYADYKISFKVVDNAIIVCDIIKD